MGAVFILGAGDWLGRRWSIILGATVMILGVVIQVTAYPGHVPLAQFIIGRVITGIGNGMNTSTIPTYQAECSRTSNRGLLICIEGATIAFGTLIAYWIDFGSSYGPADLTWRFPIAFQIVFGLLIIFGMFFLPESPRWLFTRERYEDAERVIAALIDRETSHHEVQLQKNIILDSIRAYVNLFYRFGREMDLISITVQAKLEKPLLFPPCSRGARLSTSGECFWVARPSSSSKSADATL